jgi:copper chaperone CopZ
MKTLKKVLVLLIIAAIPTIASAQEKKKDVETVKYSTSIDCDNCVNKIMTNLVYEKGISDVICNLETKEVTVSFKKTKNNPEDIRKALEKLGFTAKVIKEEEEAKIKKQ